MKKQPSAALICLLLGLVTLAAYWPTLGYKFVILDDYYYIPDNPDVARGLSWSGVAWAFQTGYFCNWHPLTWLAFMFDSQIYGLKPGGFHFTNILLHSVDSVLLFLLLKRLTGRLWPSAFVAALFAWHPLHVESVAWVSERKDVLSTLFWILTMMAYVRYVTDVKISRAAAGEQPQAGTVAFGVSPYYVLALLLFALGLMAKAMLVTLPCVLLLIDFWPLGRLRLGGLLAPELPSPHPRTAGPESPPRSLGFLVWEKGPFFVLALAASVVTYLVQKAGGAVSALESIPMYSRIANALLAYSRYLYKTIYPVDLSVMYPYPEHLPIGVVLGSALLMAGLTALFVFRMKKQPFLIVGWLWFVGTLVPVIGLIQVGGQSMADRYMYVPGIGLFIILVWGLEALVSSLPRKREILAGAGSAALAGCLVGLSIQSGYWHDSEKLFRHAVAVDPQNYLAYDGLGKALEDKGQKDEALHFYSAVQLHPRYSQGQYNLGTLLMQEGRFEEAVTHLAAALETNPKSATAHGNLGSCLIKLGRLEEAELHLAKVVELKPVDAAARNNLASVLLLQSKLAEAERQLNEALRLSPNFAEAHRNLGVALVRQGNIDGAVSHFSRAVECDPRNAEMRFNLGLSLMDQKHPAEAATQFEEALRLRPDDAWTHYRLAAALSQQHKSREALAHYRETLRLAPELPDALNSLASLLASDPNPELRDGAEAVRLAEQACGLTKRQQPAMVTTLAAAYAEVGRFPEAVKTAQEAHELALIAGEKEAADKAEAMARLYQSNHPFRETF